MPNGKSTRKFISEAKEKHGDKYDYSDVKYKNNKTPVCITCPMHGKFWQTPNSHLSGYACPKCGKERTILSNTLSTETFIYKARKIHGDKYDYSKTEYKNSKTKIRIICPAHGEFWQTPNSHLSGKGCPKCGKTLKKSTIEEFIYKARKIHGDKYDYSKADYINIRTKTRIICPTHGEFWQTPNSHLSGYACPKCGKERSTLSNTSTLGMFIKKANEIHGDKYDYSEVNYINNHTKVCIACPVHGKFWQKPNCHLAGNGCPKCAKSKVASIKTATTEEFIEKAREIHGYKYDYSKVNYLHSKTKIPIICPTHGEFWQMPNVHLQGHGCPKCATELKKMTNRQFINHAQATHNGKYDYSKINYINNLTKVCIICPKHGEFYQTPINHLAGQGCPKCAHMESMPEKEIAEHISSLIGKENMAFRDKKVLNGKELDIYLPFHKIAIEFDGLYWHNELNKPRDYHLAKTLECERQGIRLIHIFEDEWNDKKQVILSIIDKALEISQETIQLSQINISETNKSSANEFLKENHLQEKNGSDINVCIMDSKKIVSIMCFKSLDKEKNKYAISSCCDKINTSVPESEKLMFNYFIERYDPQKVRVQTDRRWNNGAIYENLGFKPYKTTNPDYYYVIKNKRERKEKINEIIQEKSLARMDEKAKHDLCMANKWYRIYDCGKIYYEWSNVS